MVRSGVSQLIRGARWPAASCPWWRRTLVVALCAGVSIVPAVVRAQSGTPQTTAPPVARLTMDEAVRLAIDRNQTLHVQRMTVDLAKADEVTAALKPNPNFSFSGSGVPIFSPSQLNFSTFRDDVTYDAGLGYTFERGGKRAKRTAVAADATDVAAEGVLEAERQVAFDTRQAFIALLLAKSTRQLAQDNLKSFQQVVELNRQRVTSGDLAEGDFLPVKLQQLQFETDVSAAEVAFVQAQAALRQLVGFETVTEDVDAVGDLAYRPFSVTLDALRAEALASRPDLRVAHSNLKLAQDQATLERGNRAVDISGAADYAKTGTSNTIGLGVSFDLPFHDRNQGNIARADVAVRQAIEAEAGARFGVVTDVVSAFAGYQTAEKVVKLYESGYLDQAKQSLDISTYAFQRGAASLLTLLDAERTYRSTQLAYRQALAAFLSSVEQVNFVVGKQVMR
jgi:outer membrane protein, heavy metal efflux system